MRFRVFLAAMLLSGGAMAAAEAARPPAAAVPIAYPANTWWMNRHIAKLAEAKAHPPLLVWLGDSITQNFERHGPPALNDWAAVWNQFYGDRAALNLGFKGDTTAHVLWRVRNGELDGTSPKLVVLLVGANNLGRLRWDAAATVAGIDAIVAALRKVVPGAAVLLIGTLPREGDAWVTSNQAAINRDLAVRYAQVPNVTYYDPSPLFETNGRINTALYWDPQQTPRKPALHPSPQGMTILARAIEPIVAHVLGDQVHGAGP